MHIRTLPLVTGALVVLLAGAPACAQSSTFNLSAQSNVSARDFIQDLASQAGLTVVFIERGQGRAATGTEAPNEQSRPEGDVYSGNNVVNTTSNTPGLANPNPRGKRIDIPLPSQFNLSFSNLQGLDAYAQLKEILEIIGFRAFRSRASRNIIYVSDKLSAPAQVVIRLRVLLVNDSVANERGLSLGTGITSGSYDAFGRPVAMGRFGLDLGSGGALGGSAFPQYSGLAAGAGALSTAPLGNNGVLPNRSALTLTFANIVLQLQLLQQVNALQTLIDQQLVVSDGETATISQNVQFRIPQTIVSNGTALSSTQAINARTTLNLTPMVLPSKKQVAISVRGDFSDPQGSGEGLVINTNSIDIPNLRLDSGGVALLGGITRHDEANIEYRVPVLSAIPILGDLFKSSNRVVKDQRLLVMIEPVIQEQPLAGAELLEAQAPAADSPRNLPPEFASHKPTSGITPLK
ncbi:MAG: type II and III secretion system protein [Aphanocapsa lilacina HA4352-LM1]|jgi:Flp pilus assembly secretin CpaC|nr:type II and III secretion system protein [Aphanocapsa lilacina HA4352-LM1]